MRLEFLNHCVRWPLVGLAIVLLSANGGCYQRTVAPEISYDQSKVETLQTEIKKLEWD